MYEKLKNKNLRQIIGGNRILKSKVLRKKTKTTNDQEHAHTNNQDLLIDQSLL